MMGDPGGMFDWEDETLQDETLDLQGKNIGATDIGAFLQSLGGLDEVSRLKVINLSDNNVGLKGEGMGPVDSLLLASRTSLTALNFRGNPLGEQQRHAGPLVALADTVEKLSRLKVLDLSACALVGLAGHRYRGLISLQRAFAGRTNRLTHLRLSDNSLHSEAALIVAGWLPSLSKLRYLDLSGRAGFDPLCGSFHTLLHLRTLLLRDIGADDGEAESIAAFVSSSARVETLDLSQNQIHIRGARYLAEALRCNGSLVSLLLGRNLIGDEGAELLATAIPHSPSLAELDVSSNGLTVCVKEAFVKAALDSLQIETFRLSGNNIPPSDIEDIQEHASANVELRAVAAAPESYNLWKASSIVEACLVAKLSYLPEGVARSLKENATFVEEEGPMRQAVLAVCPPTKAELIKSNQGALDAAMKAKATTPATWAAPALDTLQESVAALSEDDGLNTEADRLRASK
eukprot:jgi/Undpi1/13340/HiC_scaffold_8.g02999.m1